MLNSGVSIFTERERAREREREREREKRVKVEWERESGVGERDNCQNCQNLAKLTLNPAALQPSQLSFF
jgi:hypothetical protein